MARGWLQDNSFDCHRPVSMLGSEPSTRPSQSTQGICSILLKREDRDNCAIQLQDIFCSVLQKDSESKIVCSPALRVVCHLPRFFRLGTHQLQKASLILASGNQIIRIRAPAEP
eukprot:Blabericola_migrator_1__275@NODE_1070_length_5536_cov_34_507040_g232_i1_p4_GENE_NODE_1070_length_5536_cov_34_507040_g232_i1NODE_1070_length_5536_cov_34_507040_g232_i1_p4_ORF_typecomplete_len114_score12_30_NODE_1070_length_5536_cov_34_507040_g232_i132633604